MIATPITAEAPCWFSNITDIALSRITGETLPQRLSITTDKHIRGDLT